MPDTSIDQARVLLRSIPVGLAGSVVPAGVVAWLLHRHVSLWVLLVWLALLVVAHAGRVAVWLAGRTEVRAGRNGRRWLRWLRLSVLGLGLAWAWLPVTMVPAQPFYELLIAAVILAVCGAGVAQQSSDATSALLLMLPPAATMSLRLLVSADATLRIFGGLTFIYFAYLTIATYRIQASFVELSRLHALASRQSLHDALTGLPNRLALQQRLEDALARAQRLPPASRGLAQQRVAGIVAEAVVDLLEIVEVDVAHRDLGAVAPGTRQRQLQPLVQRMAVGQPGELVVQRAPRCVRMHA